VNVVSLDRWMIENQKGKKNFRYRDSNPGLERERPP
jgi:hypothetical protein